MYRPVHDALMAIDRRRLGRHVADVSTGWPDVDEKIEALRQQFAKADSADDWRDVGRRCTAHQAAIAAEGSIMFASMVRHAVALIEAQAEDKEHDVVDSAE